MADILVDRDSIELQIPSHAGFVNSGDPPSRLAGGGVADIQLAGTGQLDGARPALSYIGTCCCAVCPTGLIPYNPFGDKAAAEHPMMNSAEQQAKADKKGSWICLAAIGLLMVGGAILFATGNLE